MLFRLVITVFCSAILLSQSLAAEEVGAAFEKEVLPYFQESCIRCHGEKRQKGDFRIDTLSRDFAKDEDTELWVEIVTRLGAGEMPPEDEEQPPAGESNRIMEWISDRIKEGKAFRLAKRAPVAHYRLSREEYSNTIYDLLGVQYDTRAPGAFTEDPEWHGFERIGSELSLSPSHVEKYLKAAEVVLDRAFPDKEPRHLNNHRTALDIDWHNREKRKELDAIGVTPYVRTLIWPGHELSYLRPDGGHNHAPGLYRARIQASGLTPEGQRPPHLVLYSKKLDKTIFETDVLAAENEPSVFEFEIYLPAGKIDISIQNDVPGPSNSGRSGRPGAFVFTTLDDPKSRAPWQRKMTDDEGSPLYPFLIFDSIDWEGPIDKPEDVRKREGFFPTEESGVEGRKDALKRFAEKAWRREVRDAELERYTRIVEDQIAGGDDFRKAYKAGMMAILASKNFTYLAQGSPGENREFLNNSELASRLSYFLWSSMPDDELLDLARSGTLHEPDVLRNQFARMIADANSERFTESFSSQWLQLKKVGMFPPDKKLYPDYDNWLETSMVKETTGFFAEVFRENLGVSEFLDSDWTMLNLRLAFHYGLPIPKSAELQRVSLDVESHRGGILTQGSILSLSSDGTRHRPVHRGIWVSEAIFGKTPAPPPANVSAIQPNPVDEPKATIRQKLAAHKENASCASCHARIDPLGLAFDNYDAIGRWRTQEIVESGTGENPPVDATGTLPDGRAYENPVEFKQLLVEDVDHFAETIVEKLSTYAMRRPMTVDDREEISDIVESGKKDGYRLRTLVENLVLSEFFQKR